MRITGGIHRNRRLETPKNNDVRPTSDKVRQAIFNMLESRSVLHDAVVIDAFCGTGALGIEALSRGAQYVYFFDKNKTSLTICTHNIAQVKEEPRSQIIFQDSTKVKPKMDDQHPANLVFLDPPYNKDLIAPTIESLNTQNWLSEDVFFVTEMGKNENLNCPLITIEGEKFYGDTKVILGSLT